MTEHPTIEDRLELIEGPSPDGFHTYVGDANLDGLFNSADIAAVFVQLVNLLLQC